MPTVISPNSATLKTAIQAFLGGVSFARSYTHPYEIHRIGPLWVLRDGPRKRAVDYRREEWVVYGLDAKKADRMIRRATRGRFAVCAIRAIDEPDGPLRAAYKTAGYRLGSTEAFMVHSLQKIPRFPEPFPILQVATKELAEQINKTHGRRMIRMDDLAEGSPIRRYVAMDGGRAVGWAATIAVGENCWVHGMNVIHEYRRRGLGKAIMCRLLHDARASGAKASYLTASHTGAMLYPHVGYEMIGQLLLYTPRKWAKAHASQHPKP